MSDRKMNQELKQFEIALGKSEEDSYIKKIIQKLGNLNRQITSTSYIKVHCPELIGSTALHFAFENRNIKAFSMLLDHGADYTLKNEDGLDILHIIFKSISNELLNSSRWIRRLDNPFVSAILAAHIKYKQTANPCDPHGFSHFHAACMTNDVEAVKFFLDNGVTINDGVSVNSPHFSAYTPLHFALRHFNLETVELLLKHGASLDIKDTKGMTPLHVLLRRNFEMVKFNRDLQSSFQKERDLSEKITSLLLPIIANKDTMIIDDSGLSYLHLACAMMNVKVVEQLLKKVDDINHCVNVNSPLWPGFTPLHFAVIFNVDIVKLLVKRGTNLEAKNSSGVTPFDLCLERYKVENIRGILSLKPSWKNIIFSDGKTKLLDFMTAMRSCDYFKRFLRRMTGKEILYLPKDSALWPGFTPMHLVVLFSKKIENNSEMITGLFDKNTKIIETQDIHGCTPLHLCFRLGNMKKVIDLLLTLHEKLENPTDIADEDDLSLLHIACSNKRQNLIENILLNNSNKINLAYKGKDIEQLILKGWTPLHVAVVQKCMSYYPDRDQSNSIIKKLLAYGANINAKDAHGITPIHLLMIPNYERSHSASDKEFIIDRILLSLPDLEECVAGDLGLSHLHVACFRGELNAVKKLVNSGANVNRTINYLPKVYADFSRYHSNLNKHAYNTPLHMALKSRQKDIANFLIQRGADIFVKNAQGKYLIFDVLRECKLKLATPRKQNSHLQIQMGKRIGMMSELHFACIIQDVNLIQDLLKNGADINATISLDSELWPGYTPLHVFVQNAKFKEENVSMIKDILELLLDNGADINARINLNSVDSPGHTTLHIFLRHLVPWEENAHMNDVLKFLLDRKADVTVANAKQRTPLHMAFQHYHRARKPETFERLIMVLRAQKNFNINPESVEGITHFHIACNVADVVTVEKFLKYGCVDIHQRIDCFFNGGDTFKAFTGAGCTPLHVAVKIANYFYDRTGNPIEFTVQLETVDLLLKHGADVNAENALGETPFWIAHGFELLERLARGGPDVNARDAKGYTKLEHLVKSRHTSSDTIKELLRLGCYYNTFDLENKYGYIGLTMLSLPFAKMQKLISTVISNFPNNIKTDETGRTAIHNLVSTYASKISIAQYLLIIQQLRRVGCDLEDQDNLGRAALHYAVRVENMRGISGLLLAGADINMADVYGQTALDLIKQCARCRETPEAEDERCQHYKIYKIFASHMQKLKYCGLDVSQLNENILTTASAHFNFVIANVNDQFLTELEEMENVKIETCDLTLRNFISELDAVADYPTMSQAKKIAIDEFFHSCESYRFEKYSEVAGLVRLQYRKALMRPELIEKAKVSLNLLAGIRLPELCSHMILRFVTNHELKCMIKASEDAKMLIG